MDRKQHWQRVYKSNSEDQVSWFQAKPNTSLGLIRDTGVRQSARIIDVGGGASRLVDFLLDSGYSRLGVLDVAERGLAKARDRLGERSELVQWFVGDVLSYRPDATWDVWHDRAVFHFLVDAAEREQYLEALDATLNADGHVVIATFGPQGPKSCSGLPVVRYDIEEIATLFSPAFSVRKSVIEDHRTPSGTLQQFLYSWLERTG